MRISVAELSERKCSACGHASTQTLWLAVDLVERPELKAWLAQGTWVSCPCPACGATMDRVEPLLVTRLDPVAPVLLGLVDERQDLDSVYAELQPMMLQVQKALGEARSSTPGPMVPLTFDALVLAAGRDLANDLGDPHAAAIADAKSSAESVERYERFLNRLSATADQRHLELALDQLPTVQNALAFKNLLEEHPVLLTEEARGALSARTANAPDDDRRRVARGSLILLEEAALGGPDAAWQHFGQIVKEDWETHYAPRIERLMGDIATTGSRGDWPALVVAAEELLGIARSAGIGPLEVEASMDLGSALLEMSGEGRADRTERAVTLLEGARSLMDRQHVDVPRDLHATVMTHLGIAYAYRVVGDPKANQERAIRCLERALELTPKREKDARAVIHTDLGFCLLGLAAECLPPGSSTDEAASTEETAARVDEAIGHLRKALRRRSFGRDPRDWAYTEINLGLAFFQRPRGSRRHNLQQALGHYHSAARGFEASGDPHLLAQALHDVSAAELDLLRLEGSTDGKEQRLKAATAFAEASLAARPATIAPTDAGRTWQHLGRVHEAGNSAEAAIAAYRKALETLTLDTAPRECRDTARSLAHLIANRDGWGAAAEAWETAAEAAARAADMCATAQGRLRELHAHADVFRLAGYALARGGRLERAVEIIELGRARELSTWMEHDVIDAEALRLLDPELCEEFLSLRQQLDEIERVDRQGSAKRYELEAAGISERLSAAIEAIRSLPGFDSFLQRPSFSEIASAVDPDEALAYLVTSPDGCAALVVSATRHGPELEGIIADEPDSEQIVKIILDLDEQAGTMVGYAWAQYAGDASELDRTLADLAKALGPHMLRPVAEELRRRNLRRVCLVPAGLLGLLPLHALAWNDSQGQRCLLDDVEVAYAPPAFVQEVCRRRAERRVTEPRRLLAVGNPLPQALPLPGAEREARMVARLFDGAGVCLLVEEEATKNAVLASLPQTTYVHLACHGAASWPDDVLSAKLSMAHEEPITAQDILDLEGFEPRLVVASACQTGIIQGYETADQALSLGTVFLGAGAAGAVATLWPICDYTTALLMSHFYETLLESEEGEDRRPSKALREAQLWLRNLTSEAEDQYLHQRPELRAHRDWSRARSNAGNSPDSGDLPYGAISEWAPFLAYGA